MKNLVYLCLIAVVISCSPQITEPLNLPQPEKSRTIEDASITENPCVTFNEVDASIREDVENAYVIYRDYIRSKEYDDAMAIWSKAFYSAPAANGRVTYQFDDGISLYKRKYQAT
ncbi:MAG: hypothetical protein V3V00_09055, partial [Saprospiraceae bacterium]